MPTSDLDMHELDDYEEDDRDTYQATQPPQLMTEEQLDEKYPNRPHNHSTTFLFSELYLYLFNPLNENKRRRTGPVAARRRGPHKPNANETRKSIIAKFINRWREEVGNDIFPLFRLIVPEKDRERPMYSLKEATMAKLMLKTLQIDKNSEPGYNLLHWKLPGVKAASQMAGDFAGRCYETMAGRERLQSPGNLTVQEVNHLLDRLATKNKEEEQLPIIREFYDNMNREEMMWLIRIILRQMKVGATEKTLFEAWHEDAEKLFNVSSSLRRVCWELVDPKLRLDDNDKGIKIMQCFQPQLAQFQMHTVEKMVTQMNCTEEDPVFWIEEKLDGERMQLHMVQDEQIEGGFRFNYWSRKAKDYTDLYGKGFQEEQSALTRHLKDAFNEKVRNIILDGEMISWNMKDDRIVGFGHLKTHAKAHREDPNSQESRPLFRVFDCLYLNDEVLTDYSLRDRRKALSTAVNNVDRRLEIHDYVEATTAAEVEPMLRQVVAESSEGLVMKNPRSAYLLNSRNNDWMKVKPEYMTEFGEQLDVIVIGGYYGSGHRGGNLSSFLCGLAPAYAAGSPNPELMWSFCKVGGGMTAHDYAEIRHLTENKWKKWDKNNPPTDWIELGGYLKGLQYEVPDVWIKPSESVVLQIKAASVIEREERYRAGCTLRFPRFVAIRKDKDWKQALTHETFRELKARAEHERKEKEFKVDDARKKRAKRSRKKELTVIGTDEQVKTPYAGPETALFNGLNFYIITGAAKPLNKTKAELEQLVKANGGNIVATHANTETICIAEGNPIRVASIKKAGTRNIFRPQWLLECVKQAEADVGRPNVLLPFEPRHVLFKKEEEEDSFERNTDEYGDSFARDLDVEELEKLLTDMPSFGVNDYDADEIMDELFHDNILEGPGCMFHGMRMYIARDEEDHSCEAAERIALFAGADLASSWNDEKITHIVVSGENQAREMRIQTASRRYPPRVVLVQWVLKCLEEGTRLDEEMTL
ncbi:ATP-dependent DNA ligase [Aureobasidium subglaciale]|nr:ATP-dependent DNA ligase [Aureobasidium subglaciale]KAI5220888.1 ATP-dependent DNA ligase [Aureobasidium subglaciale]KAI5224735.1 ATP-dependent DNA ligase [Aureobasidium subglaciale]KAI5260939.1 ATP-dependent DNA ligase [Aureobasidium subglaciale]